MLRKLKRLLMWACAVFATIALFFGAVFVWPDPLFAFSLGSGRIIVASDYAIPSEGGERFLRSCERLLERSPLKAKAARYKLYVTNARWRQNVFFVLLPEA